MLQPINLVALDGYDISTTGFQTEPFCVYEAELVSIQVIVQGGTAPTGVFTLQVSSEAYFPVQFFQVPCESVSINDNCIILWDLSNVTWNWAQLSYERTSGTGEAIVIFNKKVRY